MYSETPIADVRDFINKIFSDEMKAFFQPENETG